MQMDSSKTTMDYYKHLSLFWTDLIHLMSSKPQALTSTGPMRAFAANSKKVTTELIEINEDLMGFNQYLTEYYKQLANAWEVAQKKVNLKAPEVPQDVEQIEAFKRIWIDIFDNDFTELFDSKEFGLFSESSKVARLLVLSLIGQFMVSKFSVLNFDAKKIFFKAKKNFDLYFETGHLVDI